MKPLYFSIYDHTDFTIEMKVSGKHGEDVGKQRKTITCPNIGKKKQVIKFYILTALQKEVELLSRE